MSQGPTPFTKRIDIHVTQTLQGSEENVVLRVTAEHDKQGTRRSTVLPTLYFLSVFDDLGGPR